MADELPTDEANTQQSIELSNNETSKVRETDKTEDKDGDSDKERTITIETEKQEEEKEEDEEEEEEEKEDQEDEDEDDIKQNSDTSDSDDDDDDDDDDEDEDEIEEILDYPTLCICGKKMKRFEKTTKKEEEKEKTKRKKRKRKKTDDDDDDDDDNNNDENEEKKDDDNDDDDDKKKEESVSKKFGKTFGALTKFRYELGGVDEDFDEEKTKDIINSESDKCYSCKGDIYNVISYECDDECDKPNKYELNGQKHVQFCHYCYKQIHQLSEIGDKKKLIHTKYDQDEPYYFDAKLTKMTYNDCKNRTNFNIINQVENDNENTDKYDIMKLKDIKPIWISTKGSDRICYVQFTFNYLSINETYETRNGQCDIKMIIRLFWLFDEIDYKEYELYLNPKKEEKDSFIPSWQPQFEFYKGMDPEIQRDEQSDFGVISIKDFFDDKILNKKSKKENLKFRSLGYLAYTDYFCSITVNEAFELNSFPFDCQDVPIIIQPQNFNKFAPAYYGKNEQIFMKVTGDATDLGIFESEATLCEFNNDNNRVRIMIKLKRWWSPYMLKYVFLISAATILSLSVFSLSVDDKADRLGIVLGLILTLIFIELPDIPILTVLDKYFYSSFLFLVVIAFHCGFSEIFEPEGENSGYIAESSTTTWAIVYFLIFISYHIVFIVYASIVIYRENKKIKMPSDKIMQEVEQQSMNLICKAETDINSSEFRLKTNMTNCDVFAAWPVEEDNVSSLISNQFSAKKASELTMMEKIFRWLYRLLFLSLILIQFTVSLIQLIQIENNNCDLPNGFINVHETRAIFSFAIIMLFCEIIIIFTWRNDDSSIGPLFILLSIFVGFINYVMATHQLILWNNNNNKNIISCNDDNGYLQNIIYKLYLLWIMIPLFLYFIASMQVSITLFKKARYWMAFTLIMWIIFIVAIQIPSSLLQINELEHVDEYKQCISTNNSEIFINTAETYTVYVFVLFQAIICLIGFKSIESEIEDYDDIEDFELNDILGDVVATVIVRCCFAVINWGIIIHSYTFWNAQDSDCFHNKSTLLSFTLTWIIIECIAICCNCAQMWLAM